MPRFTENIEYSEKYQDEVFEYKHVILTQEAYEKITRNKLLTENEWRALGIIQTRGWVHYSSFKPEPHILLFRRVIGTDPQTGEISNESQKKLEMYMKKKNQNLK